MNYFNPPSYTDLREKIFVDHKFKCDDCGCNLNFRHPDREHTFKNGYRMMLSSPFKFSLCGFCFGERIRTWFKTPRAEMVPKYHSSDRHRGVCQCCDKSKIVAKVIWDDRASCRFGGNWWNGHQFCKECLITTAVKGKIQSSIGGYTTDGTRYSINELGVKIFASL